MPPPHSSSSGGATRLRAVVTCALLLWLGCLLAIAAAADTPSPNGNTIRRATSFVTPTFGSARALTLSTFVTDAADLHYVVVPAGHTPLDASAIRHAAEQCSATLDASKAPTAGHDPRRQSPSSFNDDHATSQVVAASTVTVTKAQKVERLVDGLQPNSSYDVYFVAEVSGSNGVFGGVQSVLHSTTHPEPPVVTTAHVVASNDSATSLEVNATMTAPGRVYFAFVPSSHEHKELLSAAVIVNNESDSLSSSSEPPVVFALYDQSDWNQLSFHKSVPGLTSTTEYDLLLVTEAVGSGGVRSAVTRLPKVARTHALPPDVVHLTTSPQDASSEALVIEFDLRFDPQDVQQATPESLQFFTFNMHYEATRLPAKSSASSLEPGSTLIQTTADSKEVDDKSDVLRGVFAFGNFSSVELFREQLTTTQRGVIPGLHNGTSYRVTLVAETASSHGLMGNEKVAPPCTTHERAPRILTASANAVNGSVSALHVTAEMERSGGNVHYLIVPRAVGFSIRNHFHEAKSMKHLVDLVRERGSRDETEILHGTVEFSASFGSSQENSSRTAEFQVDGLQDATAYTVVVMPETHRSQGVFGKPFEQPLEAQTNENASEVLLVAAEPVTGSTLSLELFVEMTKPNDVLYYCLASSTSNEASDTWCHEANRSTFQLTSRSASSGFSFAVDNLTEDTRYSISVYAENAQRNQVFSAKSKPQVHVKTHKRAPTLMRIESKPVAASTDRITTSVATAETCLVHYAIIEAPKDEEDQELQSTGSESDSNSEPVARSDSSLPSPETIIKERTMLYLPSPASSSQSQRHVHFVAQGRVFAQNALASFATEKLRANTTYTLFVTTETSIEGNASGVYGKVQKQSVTTFAIAPKIIKATVDPTADRTDSVFIAANLSAPGIVHYFLSDVDFADPAVIRKPSRETEADDNNHTMAAASPQPPHVLRGQFHVYSEDMAMEIINGTNDSRPVEPLMFVNNLTVQGLRSGATYHVSLTTETFGSEGVFGEFPPPILVTTHLPAPKILAPPSGSGDVVVRPKRGSSDTLAIEMELSRFGEVHYALFFRGLIPDRSTAVFEEQRRLSDLEEQSQRDARNNGDATNSSEPAHVWPPIASDYDLSSLNASLLKVARLEDLGPGVWENGTISVSREDVLKGKLTIKELSKLPPNAVFDVCLVSETAGSDGIFDWEDSDHACHRVQTHAEYSNQSTLLDEISVRAINGQTDSVRIELAMSKLLDAPADTSQYKANVLERFTVAAGRVPHFVLADGKEARKEFQYNPFGSSHHDHNARDHQSASGLKGAVAGTDGVAAAGVLTEIISENASFLVLSQEIRSLRANQPHFLFFAYETSGSDGVFTRVNPHRHRANDSKTENDGIEATTHENAPTLTKLATVPTFGNTSTVTVKFDISCASCTEAVVHALVYPEGACSSQPSTDLLNAFNGGGDRGIIESMLMAESEETQGACGVPLARRKFVVEMHEREHKQSNVEREISISEDEGPPLQPNSTYSVFLATETAHSQGVLSDKFIETKVTTFALAPAFKYVRVTPRKGSTTELLLEFELERPGEVHYMAGVSGNPELNVTSPYNVSRRGRPEKDAPKVHEYPRDVVRMQRSIRIDRVGERHVEVLDYLVAGTSYDVFVVAETAESNGIYGSVLEFPGVATHANPPILLAHSAFATPGNMKSLTVGFRVDALGSVHFSIVEVDMWSPAKHVAHDSDFYGNKLAVQERLVAQESLVVASDKSAGNWREVNISVPRPGTNYTVHLVTETIASDGVFGAVASHRDVRSHGEPPTVLKLSVTPADARVDALKAQIQLTEAGHVHYIVLPHRRRLSERFEAAVAQGVVDVVAPADQEGLVPGDASVSQVVPYEAAFTIEQLKEGSVYDLYFRCETLHSSGVLGSWTHFPISARTHGLPPDVLEEVECAVSPSCGTIGREACARTPNVCGECLEGFEGASGSSNEPCSRTEGFNGSGKKKTIKISGVRVNPLAWLESEQLQQEKQQQLEPQELDVESGRPETESEQQESESEHTQPLQTEPQEQQQQQEEEELSQESEPEQPLEEGVPEPPPQRFDREAANQTLSEPQEAEVDAPSLEPVTEAQAEQGTELIEEESDVTVAAELPESKATSTSVPAEVPLEMAAEGIIACPQHAHIVAAGQCECQLGYELNVQTDTCEASLLEVDEELATASVLESSARHPSESRSI